MKLGTSRLYELQPDPFDSTSKRFFRVCLFSDVKNASDLRQSLRDGIIDAALIRPELIPEVFVLLAAANKAVHQFAHNRLSTRTLHAELIYSLSPNRNISNSLITFGVAEDSQNLLVGIFDDENGEKMVALAKKINGRPVSLEELTQMANCNFIRKVYQIQESESSYGSLGDTVVSRIATKDWT